jgi:predicted ATP-grasp superfamily ATP-dependent carboligase
MLEHIDTAIVCGDGINAHTIIRNLERLGWAGWLVLLRHEVEAAGFAVCMNPQVEHWAVGIQENDELPALIEKRYGREGEVFVFFTDERYHPAFAAWKERHPDSALRFHLGSPEHMTAVLDRYEFCRFIETRGLASVPRTIRGEEDPFAAFGESFIMRPRLSWFGVAQRERVKLVNGRADHKSTLAGFVSRGLQASDLSYQELLSIRNQDNVSICGWYGPSVQHLFCSRKVLQYPPKTGGGDVVELLAPPPGVMEQAMNILAALAYEGPFEMEFVFDEKASEFKVTELNPRFWLQQGLVEAVSGRALVSTYLGRDPQPTSEAERNLRYWVNPLYTVFRALKGDFRSLRYWCSRRSWAPFTMCEAVRYGLHYAMKGVGR